MPAPSPPPATGRDPRRAIALAAGGLVLLAVLRRARRA
jgi:hypothetical protein